MIKTMATLIATGIGIFIFGFFLGRHRIRQKWLLDVANWRLWQDRKKAEYERYKSQFKKVKIRDGEAEAEFVTLDNAKTWHQIIRHDKRISVMSEPDKEAEKILANELAHEKSIQAASHYFVP